MALPPGPALRSPTGPGGCLAAYVADGDRDHSPAIPTSNLHQTERCHEALIHAPPAERFRPPQGPDGRGRAADGRRAGCRDLFTADPVTSSRKVASVEASFGLGEALVSGLVNADTFKVRDGEVVARADATKQRAIHASPVSGTEELAVAPARQEQPALTDAQVVRLVQLGRQIEAHFGHPQDIEWCLAEGDFWILQSGRSRRCSRSPRPPTERTTCTSQSVMGR